MTQPAHDLRWAVHLPSGRHGGAIDHDHGQPQAAGSHQFRFRAAASCILADDNLDGMVAHQGYIAFGSEGSTIDNQAVAGQRWSRFRRVDEAQQVVVLRLRCKGLHMHPAERQHYIAGRASQRRDRRIDALGMGPAITGDRRPGRTGEGDMCNARKVRSFDGMGAHRRGKGVGGVDKVRHAMVPQVISQPGDAPKAADPYRYGLRAGRSRTACITERRVRARLCQQSGKSAGFRGSAQQEHVWHG